MTAASKTQVSTPRATTPPTIAKLEGGLNCLNCTRIAGSATTCSTNREDIARKVSE